MITSFLLRNRENFGVIFAEIQNASELLECCNQHQSQGYNRICFNALKIVVAKTIFLMLNFFIKSTDFQNSERVVISAHAHVGFDTVQTLYLGTVRIALYPILQARTSQTPADSTVRVLSLSRFCPDFPENRVRCLSVVWFLSGFL